MTMEASLTEDLEADSLDAVELNMALEDACGVSIPDEELAKLKMCIRDRVNAAMSHVLQPEPSTFLAPNHKMNSTPASDAARYSGGSKGQNGKAGHLAGFLFVHDGFRVKALHLACQLTFKIGGIEPVSYTHLDVYKRQAPP